MATLTKSEYLDLDAQYDGLRASYSGRGMYGDGCLGYTGDDPTLFIFDLAELLARRDNDDPSASDVRYQLVNLRSATDSMGRGIVLYFPSITVEDAYDLDDEDDDDD